MDASVYCRVAGNAVVLSFDAEAPPAQEGAGRGLERFRTELVLPGGVAASKVRTGRSRTHTKKGGREEEKAGKHYCCAAAAAAVETEVERVRGYVAFAPRRPPPVPCRLLASASGRQDTRGVERKKGLNTPVQQPHTRAPSETLLSTSFAIRMYQVFWRTSHPPDYCRLFRSPEASFTQGKKKTDFPRITGTREYFTWRGMPHLNVHLSFKYE